MVGSKQQMEKWRRDGTKVVSNFFLTGRKEKKIRAQTLSKVSFLPTSVGNECYPRDCYQFMENSSE